MRFDELPMYDAVYEVRRQLASTGEQIGAEDWITSEVKRLEITRRVIHQMQLDADQEIIEAWMRFRKSSKVNESGCKKLEVLIEVARTHGARCFYANRGIGPCSADVHLDRIIPGSRGGEYSVENCVLSCGRHNTARGDKTVEELLGKPGVSKVATD